MSAIVQHPRAVELIERRKLRKKVERAVSRLIAILDELDTDPEAEPWLGAPELPINCGGYAYFGQFVPPTPWARGANDDREEVDEDGGDVLDTGEETLGWSANVSQVGLGPNTADGDVTAPERHGAGFVRCAADDFEEDGRELPMGAAEKAAWFPV